MKDKVIDISQARMSDAVADAMDHYKALFTDETGESWEERRPSLRLCRLAAGEQVVAFEVRDSDGALLGYSNPLGIVVTAAEQPGMLKVSPVPNFALYAFVDSIPEIELPAHFVYCAYPVKDMLADEYLRTRGVIASGAGA